MYNDDDTLYDYALSNDELLYEDDYDFLNNVPPEVIAQARVDTFDVYQEVNSIYNNCLKSVLVQGFSQNYVLILSCVLYQIFAKVLKSFCFNHLYHVIILSLISVLLSTLALSSFFNDILYISVCILLGLVFLNYILVNLLLYYKILDLGKYVSLFTIVLILTVEVHFSNIFFWSRLRGIILLLSMKLISYSFDLENNKNLNHSIFLLISYTFHPGSLIFGPWFSIADFIESVNNSFAISSNWVKSVLKNAFCAIFCLCVSTCVASHLFIDVSQPYSPALFPVISGKWMQAYTTAVSFHFSHYYICYLSVLTLQVSGSGYEKSLKPKSSPTEQKSNRNELDWLKYSIVHPVSVEVPLSMSQVVVHWNTKSSWWLKNYVFKRFRYLGVFPALLCVYVASSLLHGLSVHLSVTLVSLAVYAYVEETLRLKLSQKFNCVFITSRNASKNKWKNTPFLANLFNLCWVFVNIFHLAYLGSLFDSELNQNEHHSFYYTYNKLSNLSFASHIFVCFCGLISFII